MNKKRILILFFLSINFSFLIAQNRSHGGHHFNLDNFKKERTDFLVREIGLTDTEVREFIPLCNELLKKKYELNKEIRVLSRNLDENKNRSDKDFEELVNRIIDNKLKEAQLEKEYYQKFKHILSSEKIYRYQKAEMKFMRKTVRKMDGGRQRGSSRNN